MEGILILGKLVDHLAIKVLEYWVPQIPERNRDILFRTLETGDVGCGRSLRGRNCSLPLPGTHSLVAIA